MDPLTVVAKLQKIMAGVDKIVQHPQSKLKSQKELKKITDSKEYKKADYKKKTEMLGGKVYAKGGRVGFAHGSKRPKGGWTD